MKFWIRVSPRGCVTASYPERDGESALEAHERFTPTIVERTREIREGWRHELIDGDDWDRVARPCLTGVCVHRGGAMREVSRPSRYASCDLCGHDLDDHVHGRACGERWGCENDECLGPRSERWNRRHNLPNLLSRMRRGVLLPDERKLLDEAVRAEIEDTERAYAMLARYRRERL